MKYLFAINQDDIEILKSNKKEILRAIKQLKKNNTVVNATKTNKIRELLIHVMSIILIRLSGNKDRRINYMSNYLVKNDVTEIDFRLVAYEIANELDECIKTNKKLAYSARKLLGHYIGDLERAIYYTNKKREELASALFDKETFELYNEAISHNISNSVTKISNFATSLQRAVKSGKIDALSETIDKRAEQYDAAIGRLHFFLSQTKKLSKITMRKAIAYDDILFALTIIVDSFVEEVQIDISISQNNIKIVADELTVIRAIYPIVMNAIEAGAQNIQITTTIDNNSLSFIVKNDGIPLTKHQENKVLDAFYTEKGQFGLGLNYAKKQVKQLKIINLNPTVFSVSFDIEK